MVAESHPSKALVPFAVEKDLVPEESAKESAEKYKTKEEAEAKVRTLFNEAKECLRGIETRVGFNPEDYLCIIPVFQKVLKAVMGAKRSGFDTEDISFMEKESKQEIVKMAFFNYANFLLDEAKDASPQEASVILHEIGIAVEKTRAYGVDDGEIRVLEETIKGVANMITGLSLFGSIVKEITGGISKNKEKNK